MNASEARKISKNVVSRRERIDGLLDHCYKMIRAAAEKGDTHMADPLQGIRTPVSDSQQRRVREELARQGYTIFQDGGVGWATSGEIRKILRK